MVSQFPVWTQRNANGSVSTYTSDYFAYNIGPGANGAAGNLAAAAIAQQPLQFQSDSYFEAWAITYSAMLDGATEPDVDNIFCPVTVFIADAGSGKQLFNQIIPLSQMAGPARQPFMIPGRRIFLPTSTVTFTFNNPDGTQWNSISLTLHGRKIFDITKR